MRRTSAAVSSEATVGTVSSHVANYVRKRRKTRDEEDEVGLLKRASHRGHSNDGSLANHSMAYGSRWSWRGQTSDRR